MPSWTLPGNLYGATIDGGANGLGIVFKLARSNGSRLYTDRRLRDDYFGFCVRTFFTWSDVNPAMNTAIKAGMASSLFS